MVGISEELGPLGAQLRQPRDGVAGVVRIAPLRAVPGILEDGLPSRSIAQGGEGRLLRRVLQSKHVAVQMPAVSRLRRGGQLGFGQARERAGCCRVKCPLLGGRQHLVREVIGEHRCFLIQLLQGGFVGHREVGAGMHELIVRELDQAPGFRIETGRFALFVQRRHTRK